MKKFQCLRRNAEIFSLFSKTIRFSASNANGSPGELFDLAASR
jgi:hypothetical protein